MGENVECRDKVIIYKKKRNKVSGPVGRTKVVAHSGRGFSISVLEIEY